MDTSRHKIYVGLNDSESKSQKYATEFFSKILCNVCKGYQVAFSVSELHGGYFHDDRTFVSENSLCLTLIGAEDYMADEIAKDLCAFFHQESVMVLRDTVDCRFVRETLDMDLDEQE